MKNGNAGIRVAVILALAVCAFGGRCWAADAAAGQKPKESPQTQAKSEPKTSASDTASQDADSKRWYVMWGTANLHAKLRESEGKINREVNDLYGLLIPGWLRPITFKDWSDDFKLWDVHLGLGRDLTEKTTWFWTVGGSVGKVRNTEQYFPYGLPIKTDTDFSRALFFTTAGLNYYPFGKPSLPDVGDGNYLSRVLQGTRPYGELALGYVNLHSVGNGVMSLPVLGGVYRKRDAKDYDLMQISPRIGVDFPVAKNDCISLMAGYLFFTTHHEEFNSVSVYLLHKHKF